ncbi:MAG: aminopeptidase P family protein [Sedimentisphaerales bacterium]|nr:aminopeptidase P family protein [Sedimentisphaerales bacterium]
MFSADIYIERRKGLRADIQSGLILFLGNQESPMNYAANAYPFRQDSSFLYFFGLDKPNLTALIDVDEGTETIFGDDLTIDEIVWTGPQPSLQEISLTTGISKTEPSNKIKPSIDKARRQNRTIHYLPQYRPENTLIIAQLLDIEPAEVTDNVSETLIRAVVTQRSKKSPKETEQIEIALEISRQMQIAAMEKARPGIYEKEIAGVMEGIAVSRGVRLAFPTIFSIHGETLHNIGCKNLMKEGDIAVNDSGAESPMHYASDITRTIPVGGKFTQQQREIYQIVLKAQETAIAAIKPGVEFRDIHRLACVTLLAGLKELGLIKTSPEEAVEAGAHTLFFQCGLGHMLGLDVHDMEALGEEFIGYTDKIKRRMEFGWQWLRLAKALEAGYVLTVEPGVYFIPELIDRWSSEQKFSEFINYNKVEKYRSFGGIRIEDDILVTDNGCRILGPKIPKHLNEVEAITSK